MLLLDQGQWTVEAGLLPLLARRGSSAATSLSAVAEFDASSFERAAHVGQDAIVRRYLRFEEYDNLGLLLAFYIKLVPTMMMITPADWPQSPWPCL